MNEKQIRYYLSIASFIGAMVIGLMALWIPPTGIIDSSVLWFIAQLLVFTSGLLGVRVYFNRNDGIAKIETDDNDKTQL